MDESQKNSVQWKKTISKGYILYASVHMTSWEKQNCRNRKQISGLQGLGHTVGGCAQRGTEKSGGQWDSPVSWQWQQLSAFVRTCRTAH